MRVLMNVVLLGLWSAVFFLGLGGPLAQHRRGDARLRHELHRIKSGRHRPLWSMLAVSAFALFLVLVFLYVYR